MTPIRHAAGLRRPSNGQQRRPRRSTPTLAPRNGNFGAGEVVAELAAVGRVAAAALHPQQLGDALVELVVADARWRRRRGRSSTSIVGSSWNSAEASGRRADVVARGDAAPCSGPRRAGARRGRRGNAAPPASTAVPSPVVTRPDDPAGGSRLPCRSLNATRRTATAPAAGAAGVAVSDRARRTAPNVSRTSTTAKAATATRAWRRRSAGSGGTLRSVGDAPPRHQRAARAAHDRDVSVAAAGVAGKPRSRNGVA